MSLPDNISAGDIGKRVELLEDLFAGGDPERFQLLIDFAKDFGLREAQVEALSYSGTHNSIHKAYRRSEIDFEVYDAKRVVIDRRAIELIDEIVNSQLRKAA